MKESFKILVVILVLSCKSKQDKTKQIFSETLINPSSFIELKNEINYSNRFNFQTIKNDRVLYNLSKKGDLLEFNLDKNTVTRIHLPIDNIEIDAVRYESSSCQFIQNKILYNFDYKTKQIDTLCKVPLEKNEFIIHNMYTENILKYQSNYFIQFGNENEYNRLSEFGILFFHKDTAFKFIRTPDELKTHYIHYNDICVNNIGDTFYYIYATTPTLYSTNIKDDVIRSVKLKNSKFIHFDTTKMNDMRYIYDYTLKTTYNVKLLCSQKHIFIIQRFQKNDKSQYKLLIYNKDLELISEQELEHSVDPNYIFNTNNKVIFISFKDKKMYQYEAD